MERGGSEGAGDSEEIDGVGTGARYSDSGTGRVWTVCGVVACKGQARMYVLRLPADFGMQRTL